MIKKNKYYLIKCTFKRILGVAIIISSSSTTTTTTTSTTL